MKKLRWLQGGIVGIHEDQRGTSLTEFVIILPIFVMIMLFIIHMGSIGSAITVERTQAQRDLWAEVADQQEQPHSGVNASDSFQTFVTPQLGAQHSRDHLSDFPAREQVDGQLSAEVTRHQDQVYQSMSSGGHWGESYERMQPAEGQMELFMDDRRAASAPSEVIGASQYAAGMVVDGGGQVIDYEISRGVPAVIVAGLRYGSVHAIRERAVQFNHDEFNMNIRVAYDVLVPPNPPHNAERIAIDVSGTQLRGFGVYDNISGIAQNQPLQGANPPQLPETWTTPSGE